MKLREEEQGQPSAPRGTLLDRETFGRRLRDARKALGWTLQHLSEQSGVSVPTISRAERGQLALGYENLAALGRALETTFLTGLVIKVVPLGRWPRVILEGALKMAIFLGYMFLCTRFKDLHRVFEYHGAEHKTIACYEAGLPLTVENIRRQSRFHPRCGTSFMILVIIISIFLYAVLPWTSTGMRIVYKLCMFPLLVGISYEILKWAGRSDSVLSKIVSQPGLWMQRLTTFEPDDSMIEVAIAAVTPVLPEKQEEARW